MKNDREGSSFTKGPVPIQYCYCLIVLIFILGLFPASVNAQIRVMSYNTHYCIDMDGNKSLQGIADVINKAEPDIVGLQEISDSLMAAELGRLTGMKVLFGPSLGKMDGYGDAVLSKYPLEWEGNHSIPSASSSRYQAMAVKIDFSSKSKELGKVRLINTHFDWLKTIGSKHARLATVDVIEEAFFSDSAIPTILTGDLNAVPDSEEIAKLTEYGWVNPSEGGTFYTSRSDDPNKQIDYVLFRPNKRWEVEKVYVMYGELSSDHLPIVADLMVK